MGFLAVLTIAILLRRAFSLPVEEVQNEPNLVAPIPPPFYLQYSPLRTDVPEFAPIPPTHPMINNRGIVQDVYQRLEELYKAYLKRREALLDLIYCKSCTGNQTTWQTFMNALMHIPSLSWVARPNNEPTKEGISFIVATNNNGILTGVGGTYLNGQPTVEYTFNTTHVSPVKPYVVPPQKLLNPGMLFETNEKVENIEQPQQQQQQKLLEPGMLSESEEKMVMMEPSPL